MTTLPDRPNTALLVIDVQKGVVADAHQRDEVIGNISEVVAKARAADVPVIWVQHSSDNLPMGSDEWQYVDELQRTEAEPVVHKRYGDSFEDTDLESELAARRHRPPRRHRRPDRRVRPFDSARSDHPRL